MEVSEFFPVWKQLTPTQQALVQQSLVSRIAQRVNWSTTEAWTAPV